MNNENKLKILKALRRRVVEKGGVDVFLCHELVSMGHCKGYCNDTENFAFLKMLGLIPQKGRGAITWWADNKNRIKGIDKAIKKLTK